MPTISEFYGIKILLYVDHMPPHLHIKYQNETYVFYIETGEFQHTPPKTVRKLVTRWYNEHKEEIKEAWYLMQEKGIVKKIEPLE